MDAQARRTGLRHELGGWLAALAAPAADPAAGRRAAARWAIDAVVAYDPAQDPPEHPFVWELVERVGCADLELEAGRWVYGDAEYGAWAYALARAPGGRRDTA